MHRRHVVRDDTIAHEWRLGPGREPRYVFSYLTRHAQRGEHRVHRMQLAHHLRNLRRDMPYILTKATIK